MYYIVRTIIIAVQIILNMVAIYGKLTYIVLHSIVIKIFCRLGEFIENLSISNFLKIIEYFSLDQLFNSLQFFIF